MGAARSRKVKRRVSSVATELLCVANIDNGLRRYGWFLLAFSLARFYTIFDFGRGGGAGRRFGG
jgi:hypothetical protein